MDWIESPESSNVSRFGYEPNNQTLFVEFHSGGMYQYFDVPEQVFEDMKVAPSKGRYLAQMVKGIYRYARV
jgi:hypothetical protein